MSRLLYILMLLASVNAQAQEAPVMPMPPAAPGLPAAPQAVQPPGAPAAVPAAPVRAGPVRGSLFFTDKEISRIRTALNTFSKHGSQPDDATPKTENQPAGVLPENAESDTPTSTKQQPAAPKTFTYPQFTLQSLVYHSPEDWVVQVGGQRLAADTPQSTGMLHVVAIDKDGVTLEWSPENLQRVGNVATDAAGLIRVDRARRLVYFTLRPNQTFTSYAMRVVEGKVPPVTISLEKNTGGASGTPDEPADPSGTGSAGEIWPEPPAKPPVPETPSTHQQGFSGLLNAYKQLEEKPNP